MAQNDELQNAEDAKDKSQAAADKDEKELPKLTKATEFENSVSEIERLLGIGEVKLPKVGAAKQTATSTKTAATNSPTNQTPAPEGVDLAGELSATTDSIAKDDTAAFRQKATELGNAEGRKTGTGQQTTTQTPPANASANQSRPTAPNSMTAEQAQAFYPTEYENGRVAGCNEGFTEKQVAQAIANDAVQKKKDEDMRNGVGEQGQLYKAGENDAKQSVLAGGTQGPKQDNPTYTLGFNEGFLKAQKDKAAADERAANNNPEFVAGQTAGKIDGEKAVKDPSFMPQYEGKPQEYQNGYLDAFNKAFLGEQIKAADAAQAKEEEEYKTGDLKAPYEEGKKLAKEALTKSGGNQSDVEKYVATLGNDTKKQNAFYKGFNETYVKEQCEQAEKNDYTKKPSFRRGKAVGFIIGSLNAAAETEAAKNNTSTDRPAIQARVNAMLAEKLGNLSVRDEASLTEYIKKKATEVAKPDISEDMAKYEDPNTPDSEKEKLRAQLDSKQIQDYEKAKLRALHSVEGLNEADDKGEIQRRFDAGRDVGFNEGYLKGQIKSAKQAETDTEANRSPAYKAGKLQGKLVGEKWLKFCSEQHDETAQKTFNDKVTAIREKAQQQGQEFYDGYISGFNSAELQSTQSASKETERDRYKGDTTQIGKDYKAILEQFKNNADAVSDMEALFDKEWEEGQTYENYFENYTKVAKAKTDNQDYQDRQTKAELDNDLNTKRKEKEKAIDDTFAATFAQIKGISEDAQMQINSASDPAEKAKLEAQITLTQEQKQQLAEAGKLNTAYKQVLGLALKASSTAGWAHGISFAIGLEVGIGLAKGEAQREANTATSAAKSEDVIKNEVVNSFKMDNFKSENIDSPMFEEGKAEAQRLYGSEFRKREHAKKLAKDQGVTLTSTEGFELPSRIRTQAGTTGQKKAESRWWLVYYIQNALAVPDALKTPTTATPPSNEASQQSPYAVDFAALQTAAQKAPAQRDNASLTNICTRVISQFANIKTQDRADYLRTTILESLKQFDEVPSPELALSKTLNEQTDNFENIKSHSQPTDVEKQTVERFRADTYKLIDLANKSSAPNPKKFITSITVSWSNYDQKGLKPFDKEKNAVSLSKNITKFCESFEVDTYDNQTLAELEPIIKGLNTSTFNGTEVYDSLLASADEYEEFYGKSYEEILKGIDREKGITEQDGVANQIAKEQGEQVGYLQAYFTELIRLAKSDNEVVDKNNPTEKGKGPQMVYAMMQEYVDKTTAGVKITDEQGNPYSQMPNAVKVSPTKLIPKEEDRTKENSISKIYFDALANKTKETEAKTDALTSFTYSKNMFTMPKNNEPNANTENANAETEATQATSPVLFIDNALYLPTKEGEPNTTTEELIKADGVEAQQVRDVFEAATKETKSLAEILQATTFYKDLKTMQDGIRNSDVFKKKTVKKADDLTNLDAFKKFTEAAKIKNSAVQKFENASNSWKLALKADFATKEPNSIEIMGTKTPFEMTLDKFENTGYNYTGNSSSPKVVLNDKTSSSSSGLNFKIFGGEGNKKFSISSGAVQINYEDPKKSSMKRLTISIPTLEADLRAKMGDSKTAQVNNALSQAALKTYTKEFKLGTSLSTLFNPINNILVANFNKKTT